MDGPAINKSSSTPARRMAASWCDECGYHLRGLPDGQPCPECGHVPPDVTETSSPHKTWSRCVFAGLVLLLVITIHGIASVLIQSFPQDLGGSATALNMPGPKLWAFSASTAGASSAVSRRISQLGVEALDMKGHRRQRHLRYSPPRQKATAKGRHFTTRD